MGAKNQKLVRNDLFYCLVDIGKTGPRTWVVPSRVVAEMLEADHKAWLAKPGRNGQPHIDNPMRLLTGERGNWLGQYLEAWHLLTAKGGVDAP